MTLEELDKLIIESRDFDINAVVYNGGDDNTVYGMADPNAFKGGHVFGLNYSGGEIKDLESFQKKPKYAAYGFLARI